MRYGVMLAVIASIGLFNWTPAWCQPDDTGAGAKKADRQTRHEKQEHCGDRLRGERRHGRPPHAEILSILDSDRDGTLSAAEIADASTSLKQLDANRDGQVIRDELRSQFQSKGAKGGPDGGRSGRNIADHIMSHDANGDGKVDKSKMPERMKRILDRVDTNEDSAIDRKEAEAMAKHKRHRGRRGQHHRSRDSGE